MKGSMASETNQYLTLTLGGEDFALEISKVREVLDFIQITKVPRTPEFMRGVINLRGNVVSVIDLRLSLGMSATEQTVNTCIVIVDIMLGCESMLMGMLADSVQEVIELDPDQIEPSPALVTRMNTDFIKGMGKRDGLFLMILDIDKVLSHEELAAVSSDIRRQGDAA
jgi:purine-binding chemotaxis protein CheW